MATDSCVNGKPGVVTRFVSCPARVRSADLGSVTVLVDLHTGRVEALRGWAGDAWITLARAGDSSSVSAAVGVSAAQVNELVRQLRTDGFLTAASIPRPWTVLMAVPTAPSWGTSEVAVGIATPGRTRLTTTVLAGFALASVLLARAAGRRSRSFARIITLLTAVPRWPRRRAEPAAVEHAVDCVRNVASVLPFRVACLEETAAAMLVLAFAGQRAGWCHGVAADPIRLHAWIALDGQPVAEPSSTARYTPLLQIPERRSTA